MWVEGDQQSTLPSTRDSLICARIGLNREVLLIFKQDFVYVDLNGPEMLHWEQCNTSASHSLIFEEEGRWDSSPDTNT
jgi:hypothetical protein